MKTVLLGLKLLCAPQQALGDGAFDKGRFRAWLLCQLPLWLSLVLSGWIDPAAGMARDARSVAYYAGASLAVVGFSMALAGFKSFLLCSFARLGCGFWASVQKLLPIHCLTALLEAVTTLLLLPLRGTWLSALSQVQVFGLELVFAVYAALALIERENVSQKRAVWVSLACFLLSSAWHLLSVLFG